MESLNYRIYPESVVYISINVFLFFINAKKFSNQAVLFLCSYLSNLEIAL